MITAYEAIEEQIEINVRAQDGFDERDLDDHIQDERYNFREGTYETNIPCDGSRHYESKSVATKLDSGRWVGWTYWYGGGKHAEPEDLDWEPYYLDVTEIEMMQVVRTFTKVAY